MTLPRWVGALLRRVLPPDRVGDLLGDLAEVHRARVGRRGRVVASVLTAAEVVETVAVVFASRWRHGRHARSRTEPRATRAPLFSWLDLKLALRMLVKYPGLTVVGGLAMAFGIWVAVGGFEFYTQIVRPQLPMEEGERVVALTMTDAESSATERRILRDFGTWRTELRSVVELGAFQPVERNLVVGGERGAPLVGAAINASAFGLVRLPPLHGRGLVPADEHPDAPRVVVLGYDVWRTRLGGDPAAVGRTVRIDDAEATLVGIMPKGFAFPANQSLWMPLQVDPASLEPREGPGVMVFGRLAPGATLEQAQAELTALGRRAAAARPDAYEHLRPTVLPYAEALLGIPSVVGLGLTAVNAALVLLLAIVCGNVALLVFARAAGRESELLVRIALGAGRRRLVGQLFAEALALGLVSLAVGVGAAGMGLRWLWSIVQGTVFDGTPLPFWVRPSLSTSTLAYAVLLTVLAAAIAGVLPALKVTGRGVDARLRQATAGGGGLRFGGVWTGVIVLQIALTLTFPVVAWFVSRDAAQIRTMDVGFPAEQFLTTRLRISAGDGEAEALADRFGRTARDLAERLEAEAQVAGVTFMSRRPGTYHDWRRIELDEGGAAPRTSKDEEGPGRWVWGGAVAPDSFEVVGAAAVQGRTFRDEDSDPAAGVVVVNRAFVERVLGGRNPIGRRLRYLGSDEGWDGVQLGDPPGPWYRIVGVVPDLGMTEGTSFIGQVGVYHAVRPGSTRARWLLAKIRGDPAGYANRLRAVAAEVEPALGLDPLQPLDRARDTALRFYSFWFWLVVGVSSVTLFLSLAGIYAVMSFTVARRTREIGVRVALGARPVRVAGAVFRRPLLQTGSGILTGWTLTALFCWAFFGGEFWGKPALMLVAYGVLMTAICLTACIVPTARALAVEPTDALRIDG